jgi:hypothetical protein
MGVGAGVATGVTDGGVDALADASGVGVEVAAIGVLIGGRLGVGL